MPKPIRILIKSAPRWKCFPWSPFSADDLPRSQPLPVCPAQKCRRAKSCLAAHKGLYCQRTHFSRTEGLARVPKSETDRHIANIPAPPANAAPALRMDHLREISDLRLMEAREKTKLWRAGAFTDTHGPYRAAGVMKVPPPRIYVEEKPTC